MHCTARFFLFKHPFKGFAKNFFFTFIADIKAADSLDIRFDFVGFGIGEIKTENAVILARLADYGFKLLVGQRPGIALAVGNACPAGKNIAAVS